MRVSLLSLLNVLQALSSSTETSYMRLRMGSSVPTDCQPFHAVSDAGGRCLSSLVCLASVLQFLFQATALGLGYPVAIVNPHPKSEALFIEMCAVMSFVMCSSGTPGPNETS